MIQRLADRLVLCPSRQKLPTDGKVRRAVKYGQGEVEIWLTRNKCEREEDAELFVLKFAGAGGRGERATLHPIDYWSDIPAEVWCPNPPGYGSSTGAASLVHLAPMARVVYEDLRRVAAGRPIIVTGNSLGTNVALHVAAEFGDFAGLILRNPPPLREMIVERHGWWNLRLGAWAIARQVPAALDSLANARRVSLPAVFVTSGRDRIVPPPFQQRVIEAYAGEKRVMSLPNADHVSLLTPTEEQAYGEQLKWLREKITPAGANFSFRGQTK